MQAVEVAEEAHAIFSTKTRAARVHAGGLASRALGLRMPEQVPTVGKCLKVELENA